MTDLMDLIPFLRDLLLFSGVILFAFGTFFFFVPALLIRLNSLGNTWIGGKDSAERHGRKRRLFSADYAIFRSHRTTGGVMWGLSSLFLIIYQLYH